MTGVRSVPSALRATASHTEGRLFRTIGCCPQLGSLFAGAARWRLRCRSNVALAGANRRRISAPERFPLARPASAVGRVLAWDANRRKTASWRLHIIRFSQLPLCGTRGPFSVLLDPPLAGSGDAVSKRGQHPCLHLRDSAIRRRRAFKGKARSLASVRCTRYRQSFGGTYVLQTRFPREPAPGPWPIARTSRTRTFGMSRKRS